MTRHLSAIPFLKMYNGLPHPAQVVLLSSAFSIALMTFRVIYTGQVLFIFLVWNLFLALIPYGVSSWASRKATLSKHELLLFAFVWLLFIPNAFYIITDLFHLDISSDVPQWYDLALLLSFAWSGLTAGVYSVRGMELLFINTYGNRYRALLLHSIFLLNALGIYIGRYLRFNSWDALSNPLQLATEIVYLLKHPVAARFQWGMIICYTILLAVIYRTISKGSVNKE